MMVAHLVKLHVNALLERYYEVGVMPSMGFTMHSLPTLFVPLGVVLLHGIPYATTNIVIAREDEILDDLNSGKIRRKDIPEIGVTLLRDRFNSRKILEN